MNDRSDPEVSVRNETAGQPDELAGYVHNDEFERMRVTMSIGILSNPFQDELEWMREKTSFIRTALLRRQMLRDSL